MIQQPLFKHQETMISQALDKRAYAFWADCGTGKSACAIKLIEIYKQRYSDFKALVVSPNSVLENWKEETAKWSSLRCIILQGTKTKRCRLLKEDADIFVINYEALRILETEIIDKEYDMLIFDEVQKIKSHKSLQSKSAFRISQKTSYKLALSGTPIIQSPLDIFSIYRSLNPFIFGFSYYRFRSRYALMGGYGNFTVKTWINLDELKEKVYSCAIRIKKEDCLDLPEKIYQSYMVDLNEEQKIVYHNLKKDFIAELQGKIITAPYVLTRLLRLSQVTAGFCKSEDQGEINFTANPKLIWLKQFIEDLLSDEKVIIFFRFIKELKNLQVMFTGMGIKYVEVYGETKNRQEQVNAFNNGDARIFMGQLATAGLGLNLRAAYCIFLTNSYSYGDRLQCEDRTHGIGRGDASGRSTVYIDILARDTLDLTILNCLKDKKDLATQILEDVNRC